MLFCVQHGQHTAGCGDASMIGLSLWSENLAKLTLFCVQHGQHRAGCGNASMMALSLWSENLAKLTLFCVQHGQHRAGCGVTRMPAKEPSDTVQSEYTHKHQPGLIFMIKSSILLIFLTCLFELLDLF